MEYFVLQTVKIRKRLSKQMHPMHPCRWGNDVCVIQTPVQCSTLIRASVRFVVAGPAFVPLCIGNDQHAKGASQHFIPAGQAIFLMWNEGAGQVRDIRWFILIIEVFRGKKSFSFPSRSMELYFRAYYRSALLSIHSLVVLALSRCPVLHAKPSISYGHANPFVGELPDVNVDECRQGQNIANSLFKSSLCLRLAGFRMSLMMLFISVETRVPYTRT
jgi:hypothetical protein